MSNGAVYHGSWSTAPVRDACAAKGCLQCQEDLAEELSEDLPKQVYPAFSAEGEAVVQLLGLSIHQLTAEGETYIFDYDIGDGMRSRLRLGISKDLKAGKSFPDWKRIIRNDDYYPEDYAAWPNTMDAINSFFE